jgi:monoamine oxidase
MAAQVPLEEPWKAARAAEWDGQTFETWKQANTTNDSGRFLLDLGIQSVFSAEPRDLSLLWTLFYIAAAGNEQAPGSFNRLINTADGAQDSTRSCLRSRRSSRSDSRWARSTRCRPCTTGRSGATPG